jgi:hypothetical protein
MPNGGSVPQETRRRVRGWTGGWELGGVRGQGRRLWTADAYEGVDGLGGGEGFDVSGVGWGFLRDDRYYSLITLLPNWL